jgi:hypothetical protein
MSLFQFRVILGLLATLLATAPQDASAGRQAEAPPARLSGCAVTPFQSTPYPYAGLTRVPWVEAQPVSAGITGHLFRVPFGGPRGTQPLHTGEGKILWRVKRETLGALEISGRNLSQKRETLRQIAHRASGIDYPSLPVFPTPGCWQLVLRTVNLQGMRPRPQLPS